MQPILRNTPKTLIPQWVTISEAAEMINQKTGRNIKPADIWRFSFHGYITLSIYFQSPVLLRKVSMVKDIISTKIIASDDVNTRLCYLSSECFLNNDDKMIKTEGDYITLPHFIMDTPLRGSERVAVQKSLAQELNLPAPIKGQYNIHNGVLVQDDGSTLYQVFEKSSFRQRLSSQLLHIPVNLTIDLHEKLKKAEIKNEIAYFPVYHFPDDAWFVIKIDTLENFIQKFTSPPLPQKPTSRISTPVSRLLWLACKHNDHIESLVDHPYKLLSIFEQWATEDGIYDKFSGETLKNALERGSPA